MDSNSTRSRAAVAREDLHASPWWSSAELDAIVEALDALDARLPVAMLAAEREPQSFVPGGAMGARRRRHARPSVAELASQWRAARARLDRALDARRTMLSRPVSEWPREESEWPREESECRAALAELTRIQAQLWADDVAALVAEWRERIERATGEPPRRPWVQLSLLDARKGGA